MRSRTLFDRHGAFAEYVDGELVWARDDVPLHDTDNGPQVVRDLEPYRSMIDGSLIDGRKRHRDHLRAHGCVEIGNDTSHMNAKPNSTRTGKQMLHRILSDTSERQLQQMIKAEIRNRR